MMPKGEFSDIEISHVQGIVFYELSPWFDFLTHQPCKHFFRLNDVCQFDAEQFAPGGVHSSFKELLGIHFTKAFESFDGQAAAANIFNAGENFRYREERLYLLLLAFTFNEFEKRFILSRVVLDIEPLSSQFLEQFLDGSTLIKLFVPRAATCSIPGFLHYCGVAFFFAGKTQIQIRIFPAKSCQIFTAEKIMHCFIVSVADLDEMLGQFVSRRIAVLEIYGKISPFGSQPIGVFIQSLEQFENLA